MHYTLQAVQTLQTLLYTVSLQYGLIGLIDPARQYTLLYTLLYTLYTKQYSDAVV